MKSIAFVSHPIRIGLKMTINDIVTLIILPLVIVPVQVVYTIAYVECA